MKPKRLIITGLVVFVAIPLLVFGCFLGYAKYESSRITLPSLAPGGNTVVLASDGRTVLGHIASANAGTQLADAQVPGLVKQAHMAAEDRSFYEHGPFSLKGMAWAMARDAMSGSFEAGGSTITQQYAKKFVGDQRTLGRKTSELAIAYRLEHDYTKDHILSLYVNANYYGRGAYGIEDASRTWFGVSATTLSDMNDPLDVARAAFLAAIIQQPSYFSVYHGSPSDLTHASALWDRTRYVLDGLRQVKGTPSLVPQSVIDAAKKLLPLKLTNTVKNSGSAIDGDPYLMNYVHDWLVAWCTQQAEDEGLASAAAATQGQTQADELLARGGLKIQLSIDPALQAQVVSAHKANLADVKSGVVILNARDGGILAMSGGRDYTVDPFDYALYAERPPGSTMKPFVLADAVEHGVSPQSVFAAPRSITIDGPPIQSYTHADEPGCKATLADALAASNNVVYTELISGKMANCQDRTTLAKISGDPVTPATVADLLHKAGADASLVPGRTSPAPMTVEPRLAIGATIQLSPLKLAVMAATLADGGTYHQPYLISRIDLPNGAKLFQREASSRQVLSGTATATVNQTLTGAFTHGTAVNDQVPGHPLAGKTGTTDTAQGDAWMFAFNAAAPQSPNEPSMVCAAWAGSNPNLEGADVGKVCQQFFGAALRNRPTVNFPSAPANAGTPIGLVTSKPTPATSSQVKTTVPPTSAPMPTASSVPIPSSTAHPTTPAATTPAPTTPSASSPRSVPPPEQTSGQATGVVTPPGNPAPSSS